MIRLRESLTVGQNVSSMSSPKGIVGVSNPENFEG